MIKLDPQTKVRILRERRRMSQQEVADLAGLSRQTIIRMETSPIWWTRLDWKALRSLGKVADVLGVDQDYILQEEGDEEMPQQKGAAAAAAMGTEAPQAGATVVDLSTLLQAINTGGRGPLDVTLPITDRDRLPKPAHATEQWDDQARCFLEAVRSTYMDWLDQDGADVDALRDAVSDAINAWADRHGYQVSTDDDPQDDPLAGVQIIRPGDSLEKASMLGGTMKGADLTYPVTTKNVRQHRGGKLVDTIQDADGDVFYAVCHHDTKSGDLNDHLFVSADEAQAERDAAARKGKSPSGGKR